MSGGSTALLLMQASRPGRLSVALLATCLYIQCCWFCGEWLSFRYESDSVGFIVVWVCVYA